MSGIVVVGVDESESAAKAAEKAAWLADNLGAELVVVHAFEHADVRTPGDARDLAPVTAGDVAESVATRVIGKLRSQYPGVKMTSTARVGKPGEAVVAEAKDRNATVIVVGNKRVQGIAGRVLGSIARDVAQHATCDVYVAHTVER